MRPKDQFLLNKDLRDYLQAITSSDNFRNCLGVAMADMVFASTPLLGEIEGAKKFVAHLLNLAEDEPVPVEMPSPHINHRLDIAPRRVNTQKMQAQPPKE